MPEREETALRLFVGLDLPPAVREAVVAVQRSWQAFPGLDARFTPSANLHLTLKFLGEQPPAALGEITTRLASVALPPVDTWLGRLGVFSRHGPLRILWIHLPGDDVIRLQQAVDDALAGLFPPERQFMSHLTIARLKRVRQRAGFLAAVEAAILPECRFTIEDFCLKRSTLTPYGAQYETVSAYPLPASQGP